MSSTAFIVDKGTMSDVWRVNGPGGPLLHDTGAAFDVDLTGLSDYNLNLLSGPHTVGGGHIVLHDGSADQIELAEGIIYFTAADGAHGSLSNEVFFEDSVGNNLAMSAGGGIVATDVAGDSVSMLAGEMLFSSHLGGVILVEDFFQAHDSIGAYFTASGGDIGIHSAFSSACNLSNGSCLLDDDNGNTLTLSVADGALLSAFSEATVTVPATGASLVLTSDVTIQSEVWAPASSYSSIVLQDQYATISDAFGGQLFCHGGAIALYDYTYNGGGGVGSALLLGAESPATGGATLQTGDGINPLVSISLFPVTGIEMTGNIGFFGTTPVTKQVGGVATAGPVYGATEQTMLNAVYDALQAYGLLT